MPSRNLRDRLPRQLELLTRETDVGVPAEAAREDAGGLDGWSLVQVAQGEERPDRNPPAPALAPRLVLWVADDLDDGEDRLPPRGVADGEISFLQAWPAGRGVPAQRGGIDEAREGIVPGPANEEPVLDHARGFLTGQKYAAPVRACLTVGLVAASVFVVAGCGDSSDKSATPATKPPATSATTTSTTATTGGIDPLEGAGTAAVTRKASGTETALLERVAIGRHEGYDRVVFQFRNELPGYRVEYVEPPLKEDGSGNPVTVAGSAIVLVRMEPASGFDLNTGEGVLVYKGPRRFEGAASGASVVRELVRTGDFEAVLSWAIGLEERVDFRVTTASSPARLIVDFRNH